jgi:hypothetical protein
MRRLLMLVLALTICHSSISTMWLARGGVEVAFYGAMQVLKGIFPYYMAHNAAHKDTVTINNPLGTVNVIINKEGSTGTIVTQAEHDIKKPPASSQTPPKVLKKMSLRSMAAILVTVVYVGTNYTLYNLGQELKDPSCWSLWQSEQPVADVPSLDTTALKRHLLHEAAERYRIKNEQVLYEIISDAVAQEEQILNLYESVVYTIDRLCMLENFLMCRLYDALVGFARPDQYNKERMDAVFSYLSFKRLFCIDTSLLKEGALRRERLMLIKNNLIS